LTSRFISNLRSAALNLCSGSSIPFTISSNGGFVSAHLREYAGLLVAQRDILHPLKLRQLGAERWQVVEDVAGAHPELGALLVG
jgi:hypothetical protein